MSFMSDKLDELVKDICASLWTTPADLDELMSRDFLANHSEVGIDRLLLRLEESDKWIYYRHGKYHTYKSTVVKILNPAGYELDAGHNG